MKFIGKKSGFLAAGTQMPPLMSCSLISTPTATAPAAGRSSPSRTFAGAIGGRSVPASDARPRLVRRTDEIGSFWLGSWSCRYWRGSVAGRRPWPRRYPTVQVQPRDADGSAAEGDRPLRAGERVGGHHGDLHGIDRTANSAGQAGRRHLRCTARESGRDSMLRLRTRWRLGRP